MEIHTRHAPATSLKEVAQELLIITAGILIALSLEGLVDWNHHRLLVREARTNILNELRENQRDLAKEIDQIHTMRQQAGVLIDLVHHLETNRHTPVRQFQYSFSIAELHSTSWSTASSTGALAYMPYQEVKRYAAVYDLQHDFETLQQRALAASLEVEGLGTLLARTPASISSAELADAERRLGIELAHVTAMEEVARPLNERYQELLGAPPPG